MTDAAFFDGAADEYDRSHRRHVPGSEEFYGAAVAAIPYGPDDSIRVLDLGAGTGLLSAMVAAKFPRSHVTLVDASVEMLRVARRRFSGEPGRFEYRVMDYAREPLPGAPPDDNRGYDVVVSALSIHHITDGDKRGVFEKVHDALVEGGIFVNADQTPGETPQVDKNATLKAQLAWMEEAGFEEVACDYENKRFVVYGGRKARRDLSTERTDG